LHINIRENNHRELNYRVTKLVFLIPTVLTVIPLISPNLILIQYVAVPRNFDMSTQICHIRRDFSFGADVFLLGIWVQRVDDELWIDHMRVRKKAIRA
jgi:hypothetical protein